jgi:hypothetical protein
VAIIPTGKRRRTDYEVFAAAHPDFIRTIAGIRSYRDREFAKLAALAPSEQRTRVRKLLRCHRLALLYAFDAMRRVQRLPQATPASISALAAQCNPFAPSHEPVHRVTVPSEARRPIMPIHRRRRVVQNYGPLKRMHQMLVADVLAHLHPPRPDQFLFHGGMPMALAAIEAAYRAGYSYAVEIDMSAFYATVRLDGLAELLHPLPVSVTHHVVWDYASRRGPDDDYAAPSYDGDPSRSGLVGLSLGAATSPIVGERIIRLLLDAAPVVRVVTYADNVLVLGRDRAEVVARAEHLASVAEGLEAGPLRPRIGNVARFRDGGSLSWFDPDNRHGVEFCKQVGVADRIRSLSWRPSDERLEEHRIADGDRQLSLEQIAGTETQVSHWRRSYPTWRDGDAWEAARLAELGSGPIKSLAAGAIG